MNEKNVMYVKKIMFGIHLHVVVKMETIYNVLQMIQQLRVMKLYTRKASRTTKKQKYFQQILMRTNQLAYKAQNFFHFH